MRGLLARNADAADWLPTESPGLWAVEEDRIPDRIGPFAIVGIIGKGGMGTVLKGVRDDGLFGQTVAIKLMRVGLLEITESQVTSLGMALFGALMILRLRRAAPQPVT